MIPVLVHLAVIGLLAVALPLLVQELVARSNAAMVDQSALAYTGATTRKALVNRRAHVNRDPRFAQNPANTGFIFFYDCTRVDLRIEGILPSCLFFGVSVYDRFSMPAAAMAIDQDVEGPDGRYTVFLTTRPTGARNEIDVRAVPCGTGIIRCSHMPRPELIERYEPTLEEIAPSQAGAGRTTA